MNADLFSCRGKVVVVTGGSGLIGREIVRGLKAYGARVVVADVQPLRKMKGAPPYVVFDITSEQSITSAMDTVVSRYGRIDVLINSAYPRTPDWGDKLEDIGFESWKINVNDHLGGYFLASRAAAERMKKAGRGGAIINIASIYGIAAPDFSIYAGTTMTMPAGYSAIKAGIIGFTRYLSTYYAGYNIRANVISPGGIFNNQPDAFVKQYCLKTPLGRMGTPEDIVGAAVFLASDASSYVTGTNLIVDGGWTAW